MAGGRPAEPIDARSALTAPRKRDDTHGEPRRVHSGARVGAGGSVRELPALPPLLGGVAVHFERLGEHHAVGVGCLLR